MTLRIAAVLALLLGVGGLLGYLRTSAGPVRVASKSAIGVT